MKKKEDLKCVFCGFDEVERIEQWSWTKSGECGVLDKPNRVYEYYCLQCHRQWTGSGHGVREIGGYARNGVMDMLAYWNDNGFWE